MERYTRDDVTGLVGREVVDRDGTTVGYVDLVFVDHESGRPEWIGVWNGLPTGRRTLVPLRGVEVDQSEVRVPWPEDVIRDAQTYDDEDDRGIVRDDPDGIAISPEKERAAYEHYGLEPDVTPTAGVVRLRAVVVSARGPGLR